MRAGRATSVSHHLPWIVVVLVFILVPALSATYCPPITLGEGSELYPQRTKGGNVTMYRVFTNGNPHKLKNITWSRVPADLSCSDGRYRNNTIFTDNEVNASITLWNLMIIPDKGMYTITVCSNCTCNKTTFDLNIFPCDPTILPQPIQLYNRTLIAEPSLSGSLQLSVPFHGIPPSEYPYPLDWTYGGKDICIQDSTAFDAAPFSCNTTDTGNCTFTANLYIFNPSHANSGNYTVQAIGSGVASQKATIFLDILNEPRIDFCNCTGHTKFVCRISNYSKYDEVVVVENDQILFNKSTKGLSFGCWPNVPDPSIATCTVNVSTSGKASYKLCVGYNSSVPHKTKLQCSRDIIITSLNKSYEHSNMKTSPIVGGTVLALLVLILALCVATVIVCRMKSSRTITELHSTSETRPLLASGRKSHSSDVHIPPDWPGGQPPGTSPGCFPSLSTTSTGCV